MKLYGKKVLAMTVVVALVLSLCTFSAFAGSALSLGVGVSSSPLTVSDASAIDVRFTSSDPSKATVGATSGIVTGVAIGSATITATYNTASGLPGIETWTVTIDEGTITSVWAVDSTITVPYGMSRDSVYAELGKVELMASNGTEQFPIANDATWYCTNYNEAVGSVNAFTATVRGKIITVYVTVEAANIQVDFGTTTLQVPQGTSQYDLELPTSATVKFLKGSTVVDTQTWYVGSNDQFADWTGTYNGDVKGTYTFSTMLNSQYAGSYNVNSSDLRVTVQVTDSFTVGELTTSMTYSGDYYGDSLDLEYVISNILEDQFYDWNISIYDVNVTDSSYYCKYGSVYSGEYTLDIDYGSAAYTQLMDGKSLTEEIPFTAVDNNGNTYAGKIVITITSGVRNYEYTMGASEFDFEFGKWIAAQISADMVETLDYVEFYIEDGDGGTMYADKDLNEFEEDEAYSYITDSRDETSELEKLFFVPNGTENKYELEYVAYGKYNQQLEGTITIECREFLLIRDTIGTDEYLTFDSNDFVEMIENSSYDKYELISIDSLRISGGGKLFYDYDEDSNRNTTVSSRTDYFVDSSEDYCIDYITYVPAEKAETSTVTISFKLNLKNGNKSQSPSGIYQINVIEKADITIQAGYGQTVTVDYELFEEFFLDNVSTSKKSYDIAYIVFKNAPASKAEGYLYSDGDKITNPDSKKFYVEDPDDGDYPMDDLTFAAGNTAKTTQAEFAIYGKRNATSNATKLVEGSVDFIVGSAVANSLSGTIKASETMSFASSISAFESLGNNDNEYIVFTSLPVGGKLVYNWGSSGQEDVQLGTKYYLTYSYGEKLLSNITFIPSYSASKTQKAITIGIKGYNAKDKAVVGTINIGVTHSSYSAQFTDVTDSTYADSVDFLLNQGITTGTTAYTFSPYGNVTRAQFVTFLWRAAGEPSVYGVTNTFSDVKSTGTYAYAYQAILWAVQNGITTGRSATTFDPGANVTHQELLTFLYRYDVNYLKHSAAKSSTVYYSDFTSVASYAQDAVKWADYKGILTGYTIQPTVAGTRATVALWLHRMLTL